MAELYQIFGPVAITWSSYNGIFMLHASSFVDDIFVT